MRVKKTLEYLIYISVVIFTYNASSNEELQPTTNNTDNQFISVLHKHFVSATNDSSAAQATPIKSARDLYNAYQKAISAQRVDSAIRLLLTYKTVILTNTDTKFTHFFFEQLLTHEAVIAADALTDLLQASANSNILDSINYQYARYYFEKLQYKNTLKHLRKIKNEDAFNKEQQDYLQILLGVSLQKTKKHRTALKTYEKLNNTSNYYQYIKLNESLAFTRQGWWTDAQESINQALQHKEKPNSVDLTDRLLLALGYSQFKNEFFRNARATFRKIEIDSEYKNQAILGIGLSALSLEDYSGALTMFEHLQNSDIHSLEVLESYILSAITYEKSRNYPDALNSFTNAINFYNLEILYYQKKLNQNTPTQDFQRNSEILDISPSRIKQYVVLLHILKQQQDPNIIEESKNLLHDIEQDMTQLLSSYYQKQISHIESYKSQSQYGLARLYDNAK